MEKQFSQLQKLNAQFIARSGMEEAVSTGVLRGRPFGGVSICWSPDLNHAVKPLSTYKHKRIVAVELTSEEGKTILISAYMPFLDSRNRASCIAETIDAISMIDSIINDHPNHSFVIGGDLNTELKGESPFDYYWTEMMNERGLTYCSNLFTGPGYTYHHQTLNHKKHVDHFIISKNMLSNNIFTDHVIVEDGDNPSDHLPIMMKCHLKIQAKTEESNSGATAPTLKWNKITNEQKAFYSQNLSQSLANLEEGTLYCPVACHCESLECKDRIQCEYDNISNCLKNADLTLPRHVSGREKEWWTSELTHLKRQSIEIHNLWIAEGRPRNGPTYQERLRVRLLYRQTIKAAQAAPKQKTWNRLYTAMEDCNSNQFWKSWKNIHNKNSGHSAPVVDGCSSDEAIANTFMRSFKQNSEPNNKEKVDALNAKFADKHRNYILNHTNCSCSGYNISLEQIMDSICSMNSGKCADADGLTAEHLHNAPLILFKKLETVFNAMLKHGFVPKQFRFGFMIPLIKDTKGNHGDVSNYRGITISPVISKVFEHILKITFADHLTTSAYQFGFKRKNSTTHALFCLRRTVEYYNNNGSRVYCSFLDASKAFDRLVHSGLFSKLIDRNIPRVFLDILMTWHDGLFCQVRWNGVFSEWFNISAGVRQGGLLSPDLYSIYVDDLIIKLQALGKGCHLLGKFAAAIFYADDMAVLSPSVRGLQKILDVCSAYCTEWDIKLNANKSKNLFFGKGVAPEYLVKLNGDVIPWETKWPYLGVHLKSGPSFNCCVKDKLSSFYRSLNSILRIEGRADEIVRLRLLEAHCLPVLTYAIEIIHVKNRDERRQLRVAYNAIFRKIFGFRYHESVTDLQHNLGRDTWEELVQKRTESFHGKCLSWPSVSLVRSFV